MQKNIELQDIVDERIPKIRAVLNCLLTAWERGSSALDRDTIYNTLWSIDDDLREIMDYKGEST